MRWLLLTATVSRATMSLAVQFNREVSIIVVLIRIRRIEDQNGRVANNLGIHDSAKYAFKSRVVGKRDVDKATSACLCNRTQNALRGCKTGQKIFRIKA